MSDQDKPTPSASQSSKRAINTLLPPGNVHFFSSDEGTIKTVKKIAADWRFARVKMKTEGTSLDEALSFYKNTASPDILIIQTDHTDDTLETQLETLAEHCSEDTAAIVIGPKNDVKLYRKLTAMGISDYLVAPLPEEELISTIGNILLDLKGTLGSQLIGVIGTKGGVGTSTLTQIVSLALSENLKQKTLLMDAAAGHSSLWSLFSFKPSRTIIEAAKAAVDRDHEELAQIMVTVNDQLSVINSGAERLLDNPVALQAYTMLLDRMLYIFPHVIIDLSGAPELIQREILSRAQHIFVATTPTLTSLSISRSLIKEIKDLRGGDSAPITLINNKKGQVTSAEVSEKDISETIGLAPKNMMSVEYDASFFLGLESDGKAIADTKNGQKLMTQFADILTRALSISSQDTNSSVTKTGAVGCLLNYLTGKSE